MHIPRRTPFLIAQALFVSSVACSPPMTDIVATVSEDVGHWDVINAHTQDRTLTADLCLARASSADAVSERVLMQLRSRGLERVDLTMYGREGREVKSQKVSWTLASGKQLQEASTSGQNPCGDSGQPAAH